MLLLAFAVACTGGDDGASGATDGDAAALADDGGGSVAVAPDDDAGTDGAGGIQSSGPLVVTESTQRVIAALERTQLEQAYRFEMLMTMEGLPDQPFEVGFEADGAVDPLNQRMQMRLDMSSLFAAFAGEGDAESLAMMQALLGDGVMEMIADGDTVYMRFALFSMLFGVPTEWISITESGSGAELFSNFSGAGVGDPSGVLASLEALGSVTETGRATLRGVETMRYSALIGVQAAIAALSAEDLATLPPDVQIGDLPNVPFDIWLDDDGYVRRVEMSLRFSDFEAGAPGSMSFVMDYFGFGEAVTIELPPAEDVTELDEDLFGDSLELLGAGA